MALQHNLKMAYQVVNSSNQDQRDIEVTLLLDFKNNTANPYRLMLTYLLTYLLTPWRRVLLEKLTSFHLVKKFPAFYGT